MGAEEWQYFVKYQPDIEKALRDAQEHVFKYGDYRGEEMDLGSLEELRQFLNGDSTTSILDIENGVSAKRDFSTVAPLSEEELSEHFGTKTPSHQDCYENQTLWHILERGQSVYVIVYEGGEPSEIFFTGKTFD